MNDLQNLLSDIVIRQLGEQMRPRRVDAVHSTKEPSFILREAFFFSANHCCFFMNCKQVQIILFACCDLVHKASTSLSVLFSWKSERIDIFA